MSWSVNPGTLIDTASVRSRSCDRALTWMEASPSPVYGAALLMRFGGDPIRGSNPRASARVAGSFRTFLRVRGLPVLLVFRAMHAQCMHTGAGGRQADLAPRGLRGTM